MRIGRLCVVLVAVVSLVALSGCAGDSGYTDLDRGAAPGDEWPSDLPGYASDSVDTETTRLAGEFEGSTLYVTRSVEPQGGICLLAHSNASDWVVGCSPAGLRVSASSQRTYAVLADGADSEGLEAVSKNVYVVQR
jgi:hypothetical protein